MLSLKSARFHSAAILDLTGNTQISNSVVWHVIDHLVQLLPLRRILLWIHLVESIEPAKLDKLLREKESSNEEGLWAEKRLVCIMDIFHIGRGEHAILLGDKVDHKRGRCQPFGRRVRNAHLGMRSCNQCRMILQTREIDRNEEREKMSVVPRSAQLLTERP